MDAVTANLEPKPAVPPAGPRGLIVWGNTWCEGLMMLGTTAVFLLVALGLGGWKYDQRLWQLWLGTGIGTVTTLYVYARVDRFTLDTRKHRWFYCRGWRWRPGHEAGSFDELKGFLLFSRKLSVLDKNPIYAASLEFADGYRYFPAVLATSSVESARKEAQELSHVCDLPLNRPR